MNKPVVFDAFELSSLFGPENLVNIDNSWKSVGISTDTRTIESGNLFIALVGENFDAHDKLAEAFDKGASAVVVSQKWFDANSMHYPSKPFVTVPDTLHALGTLANMHRKRFDIPVIAVAGSNGKTTTKDLVSALLGTKLNVLSTTGNLNNQVGVPLMLFRLDDSIEAAVIEIGTNEPGEISILSEILAPTHGMITNIGEEHLEKLIDLDGVELEETYLYGYLQKHGGMVYMNMDDPRLIRYYGMLDRVVTFGINPDADIRARIDFDGELHPVIELAVGDKKLTIKMQTSGMASALNAIAAAAVGMDFGLEESRLRSALESFQPDNSHGYGRMLVERFGGITVINDCYNANPSSMAAALDSLAGMYSAGEKYAVLGDMLELGEASFEAHTRILQQAVGAADRVFITGSEMSKAYAGINEMEYLVFFDDKASLEAALESLVSEGDILLVKGSRGMRMEEIIERLKRK